MTRSTKSKRIFIPAAASLLAVVAAIFIAGGNLGWFGSRDYTVNLENGDSVVYRIGSTNEASFAFDFPVTSRELTDDELDMLFPAAPESRTAIGTFRDDDGILIRAEEKIGDAAIIFASDSVPVNDVVIKGNETTSTVSGIPVTTGYFITKPNSKGNQNAIFFGSFTLGSTNVYVECFGAKSKAGEVSQYTAELILQIIENGEPDFSAAVLK